MNPNTKRFEGESQTELGASLEELLEKDTGVSLEREFEDE